MSKSVVILCLNGKRRTIKFTPSYTVAQIIEDVCFKEKIDASLYALRTSKAVIDRTLPWRYTNLPNNAKLELCHRNEQEKDISGNVKIALQLQNGQRLMGEFPTTTFLSDILKQFSDELKSVLNSEIEGVPTVVYMRQNLVGNDVLSSTSLEVLGIIKGSALLRLSYSPEKHNATHSSESIERLYNNTKAATTVKQKVTKAEERPAAVPEHDVITQVFEKPTSTVQEVALLTSGADSSTSSSVIVDAAVKMDYITDTTPTQKECNPTQNSSSSEQSMLRTESKGEQIPTTSGKRLKIEAKSATAAKEEPNVALSSANLGVEAAGVSKPEVLVQLPTERSSVSHQQSRHEDLALDKECPRRPMLFNERDRKESTAATEVSDEFFDITVDDLRKMLADLKHERKKYEEKEMLTEEQRKNRKIQLASKYPHIVIRIILPDRTVLQGIFRPLEKLHRLYEFVQEHTTVKTFYLFTSPPKQMLKDKETTLFDSNLAPAARIYFGTKEATEAVVKEQTLSLLCTGEDANKELQMLRTTDG